MAVDQKQKPDDNRRVFVVQRRRSAARNAVSEKRRECAVQLYGRGIESVRHREVVSERHAAEPTKRRRRPV